MSQVSQIAIFGHGVVGGGVSQILLDDAERLAERSGTEPVLVAIVTRQPESDPLYAKHPGLFTTAADVWQNQAITIVVETIGGSDGVALEVVETALRAGKRVVTANKALVAKHWEALFALVDAHGGALLCEAAVGGGIPVLHALESGLIGEQVQRVMGILNGTTNYILTEMAGSGADYAGVLADAQAQGYAEADPTADVAGHDAAHKLSILTALAFGARVAPEQIPTTGIEQINSQDFANAAQLGARIKLLGRSVYDGQNGVWAEVAPCLLKESVPLAKVDGVRNSIAFYGKYNESGNLLSGEGAGRFATASAVVSDICTALQPSVPQRQFIKTATTAAAAQMPYYLRFIVTDTPGIMGDVCTVLGKHGINIDAALQGQYSKESASFALTVQDCEREAIEAAVSELAQREYLAAEIVVMAIVE